MGKRGTRLNTRSLASGLFEVAGFVAIVTGCWWIAAWLGMIVAGLALVAVGVAIEKNQAAPAPVSQLRVAGEGFDDL